MKKQFYRMLFIALLALMQTTWVQAQVNSEVRKVPPGAPKNVVVGMPHDFVGSQACSHYKKKIKTKEDFPTYRLSISYDYDNNYLPGSPVVFCQNEIKDMPDEYLGNNGAVFSLPEGTYDVLVRFYKMSPIYTNVNDYYVIKENVILDKDITIVVSPQEAKNIVEFKFMLPNGERAKLNYHDWTKLGDDGVWLILEQGNVANLGYVNAFKNKDNDGIYVVSSAASWLIDSPESNTTFYINDVSDNWAVTHFEYATDYDNNAYATCFDVLDGFSEDMTRESSPSDLERYEMRFAQSAYGKSVTEEMYHSPSFQLGIPDSDLQQLGHTLNTYQDHGDVFNYYIGKGSVMSDYLLLIKPAVIDSRIVETIGTGDGSYTNTKEKRTEGQPFVVRGNKTERICNGMASSPTGVGFTTYKDEAGEFGVSYLDRFAYNEPYSYLPDKMKGIQGANVPIFSVNKYSWELYTYLYLCCLGRYGEMCENDYDFTNLCLKQNGETVAELEDVSVMNWWGDEISSAGEIDITLTCKNRIIDGLQGQNKTVIHYDQRNEDATAPTLQMLHFKDDEGFVTDCFTKAEDGYVEFSAGDYNEGISEANYLYYDRSNASASVSYSPYEQNNWNDLYVEEVDEYYSDLTGWFYRGSLADVTGTAEKGWFDLKIRLEDEAGNWQEQVISPAFRINDLVDTGIENIEHSTLNIEHAEAVYDVMGRHVGNNLSTRQLVNSSTCNKGIRIVRKANGDVRKVVAK